MTATQKADEIFHKFYALYPYQDLYFIAKKAALIAVDEILSIGIWEGQEMAEEQNTPENCEEFWVWVKHEIEKL